MIKKILLTPNGLKEKEQELKDLTLQRVAALRDLVTARNMGDLSENGAYKAARFRLSGIDRRIRYLENVLRRVTVLEKRKDGRIGIGSVVVVQKGGESLTLELVDGHESDFMRGKISLYSPIGKALMGGKEGEKVQVETMKGRAEYLIIKIK